jgi:hypothetical protein
MRALITLLLCAGLIVACAQVRKATYPDDFVYLDQKQVKNEMVLLSIYLRQIDQILLDETTISSEQQGRLMNLLSSIETTADRLGAGTVATNHLLIDENIDHFRAEVHMAMQDVAADPPNYFSLGRLSGSCVACHRYR